MVEEKKVAEPVTRVDPVTKTVGDQDNSNAGNTTTSQPSPITQLLDKVIQAFVAIVDGFVQVLSDNATAIAELSITGALLAGATRVFGEAVGGLKGFIGL